MEMKSYVFPGNIESDILNIAAEQIPYMRTAQFSALVKESETMFLDLIACEGGRVLFYTASGTAAMEAVVTNFVALKKKAFILSGGSFGRRWKDICEYYSCVNVSFELPFAKDADYEKLEAAVAASRPEVFLCQHHETSTGQLFDLKKISNICKRYNVYLVVDVISSFLADPFNMDALGVDICVTSSQKGLNIPPGLSFVVLGKRVLRESFAHKGYYLDFKENLKNLERGQTPYSPATTLFLQLHARLKKDIQLGYDSIVNEVREKALYFRSLCQKNSWEMPVEVPSNCITGFFVHRNGDILFVELMKMGIYIMPGGTPNYFRVSHLGVQTYEDLDRLASCIKEIENR